MRCVSRCICAVSHVRVVLFSSHACGVAFACAFELSSAVDLRMLQLGQLLQELACLLVHHV